MKTAAVEQTSQQDRRLPAVAVTVPHRKVRAKAIQLVIALQMMVSRRLKFWDLDAREL